MTVLFTAGDNTARIQNLPLDSLVKLLQQGAERRQQLSSIELNTLFARAFAECGKMHVEIARIKKEMEV